MTTATFNYKNEKFVSFEINGHAEYAEYGYDIVCSAITTATFTTVGILKRILSNNFLYTEKEANIKFELKKIDNELNVVDQIILNYIEVLENIQAQYPKHLKIKIAKN